MSSRLEFQWNALSEFISDDIQIVGGRKLLLGLDFGSRETVFYSRERLPIFEPLVGVDYANIPMLLGGDMFDFGSGLELDNSIHVSVADVVLGMSPESNFVSKFSSINVSYKHPGNVFIEGVRGPSTLSEQQVWKIQLALPPSDASSFALGYAPYLEFDLKQVGIKLPFEMLPIGLRKQQIGDDGRILIQRQYNLILNPRAFNFCTITGFCFNIPWNVIGCLDNMNEGDRCYTRIFTGPAPAIGMGLLLSGYQVYLTPSDGNVDVAHSNDSVPQPWLTATLRHLPVFHYPVRVPGSQLLLFTAANGPLDLDAGEMKLMAIPGDMMRMKIVGEFQPHERIIKFAYSCNEIPEFITNYDGYLLSFLKYEPSINDINVCSLKLSAKIDGYWYMETLLEYIGVVWEHDLDRDVPVSADDECCICFGPIIGEKASRHKCKKFFCTPCIDTWLSTRHAQHLPAICPMCTRDVTTSGDGDIEQKLEELTSEQIIHSIQIQIELFLGTLRYCQSLIDSREDIQLFHRPSLLAIIVALSNLRVGPLYLLWACLDEFTQGYFLRNRFTLLGSVMFLGVLISVSMRAPDIRAQSLRRLISEQWKFPTLL